jgi:hypothetical protein
MFRDFFNTIHDALYSQIVPIPLGNTASYIYVILNLFLSIFAVFSYQQDQQG